MTLDTIPGLLSAIERLPARERARARERVALAVERPAPAARAALGLLALDLAGLEAAVPDPAPADEVELLVDLRRPTVAVGT